MRDWIEVARAVERVYPTATGGTTRDDSLRASLVGFADSLFKEIEREQRWSAAYTTGNLAVVAGTATYSVPTGMTVIEYVYHLDSSGNQLTIDRYDESELRRVYGEGVSSTRGEPVKYSLKGSTIQLFPVPDASYTVIVEGYQALNQIVETTGNTTATSATLTVPSSAYLTAMGLASSGTTGLSVRGAGNLAGGSVADTHVTSWTAFPTATTVTMGNAAIATVSDAQVFFNSQNWLITDFDKVVLFGVLRMVASYLMDTQGYTVWEARFQNEMEKLREYEFDRARSLEMFATAHQGQRQSQLRRQDALVGIEVRGGD